MANLVFNVPVPSAVDAIGVAVPMTNAAPSSRTLVLDACSPGDRVLLLGSGDGANFQQVMVPVASEGAIGRSSLVLTAEMPSVTITDRCVAYRAQRVGVGSGSLLSKVTVVTEDATTVGPFDVNQGAAGAVPWPVAVAATGIQSPPGAVAVVGPYIVDAGNSSNATLDPGATWTGDWKDTLGYAQLVTSFLRDCLQCSSSPYSGRAQPTRRGVV